MAGAEILSDMVEPRVDIKQNIARMLVINYSTPFIVLVMHPLMLNWVRTGSGGETGVIDLFWQPRCHTGMVYDGGVVRGTCYTYVDRLTLIALIFTQGCNDWVWTLLTLYISLYKGIHIIHPHRDVIFVLLFRPKHKRGRITNILDKYSSTALIVELVSPEGHSANSVGVRASCHYSLGHGLIVMFSILLRDRLLFLTAYEKIE